MDFVRFSAPSHPALMAYQHDINGEAEIAKIPPCLLAAIVWRETGGRNILQIGMDPGPGCGVGLTQITSDVDWSVPGKPTYEGYALLVPADNLYVAAAFFLAPDLAAAARLQRDDPAGFAAACRGQQIYAAAGAFNGGEGALRTAVAQGVDFDAFTTNDYASDVLAKYLALVTESRQNEVQP